MKLIIDVPKETFNCLKNMVNAECVDPYSLADIIVNNGIPIEERPQGDLISREALKEALNYTYDCAYIDSKSKEGIVSDIIETIDNAPIVEKSQGNSAK